jgi:hypothetical protein
MRAAAAPRATSARRELESKGEEHMEGLLKEGALYFQTLKYFRDLVDGGELRGDPDEALSEVYYYTQMTEFTMMGEDGKVFDLLDPINGVQSARVQFRYSGAEGLNVYCLYAVTPQSVYIETAHLVR